MAAHLPPFQCIAAHKGYNTSCGMCNQLIQEGIQTLRHVAEDKNHVFHQSCIFPLFKEKVLDYAIVMNRENPFFCPLCKVKPCNPDELSGALFNDDLERIEATVCRAIHKSTPLTPAERGRLVVHAVSIAQPQLAHKLLDQGPITKETQRQAKETTLTLLVKCVRNQDEPAITECEQLKARLSFESLPV